MFDILALDDCPQFWNLRNPFVNYHTDSVAPITQYSSIMHVHVHTDDMVHVVFLKEVTSVCIFDAILERVLLLYVCIENDGLYFL